MWIPRWNLPITTFRQNETLVDVSFALATKSRPDRSQGCRAYYPLKLNLEHVRVSREKRKRCMEVAPYYHEAIHNGWTAERWLVSQRKFRWTWLVRGGSIAPKLYNKFVSGCSVSLSRSLSLCIRSGDEAEFSEANERALGRFHLGETWIVSRAWLVCRRGPCHNVRLDASAMRLNSVSWGRREMGNFDVFQLNTSDIPNSV